MLNIKPTNLKTKPGRNFYVAANGDDTNSGRSPNSPWATINKVNDYVYGTGLRGGDRILFRGGDTFTGSLYINNEATPFSKEGIELNSYGTGKATIQTSGSGSRPAILYNQVFRVKNLKFFHPDYITAGDGIQIFLTGVSDFNGIQIVNCEVNGADQGIRVYAYSNSKFSNLLIQGNQVTNCKRYGIYANSDTSSKYLNSAIIRNNNVDRIIGNSSTEEGGVGNGIVLGDCFNSILENNFADGAACTAGVANNLIWIYNARNTVIRDNTAINGSGVTGQYDRGGFGLDLDCNDCLLEDNFAYNCQGEGIFLAYGNTNTVRNNILVDCAYDNNNQGAIHIEGGNAFPEKVPALNLKIYNNTIVCRKKKVGATYDPFPITNTMTTNTGLVANNILYSTLTNTTLIKGVVANGLTFSGNNYYSTVGTPYFVWGSNALLGLTNWRVNGPREKSGTTNYGYSADPGFVNASGTTADDFRLQGSTIPAGLNLNMLYGVTLPSADYFGNATSGSSLAIGAHTPPSFTPVAAPATSNAYGTYVTALIARLTATYSTSELASLQTFFVAANQNGAIDQLEFLQLCGWSNSQSDAQLNTLSTSFNLTVGGTGGVTFTTKVGIKTGTSSYLNTGFNPSTATKYQVNSATLAAWMPTIRSTASGGVDIGAADGTNAVALQTRYTGNLHRARLNEPTSASPPTIPFSATNKFIGVRRNNSTSIQYITNGTVNQAQTFNSSASPNKTLYIGAYNSTTVQAYSSDTYGAILAGAGLTDTQIADVYNALATLLG